MLPMASRPGSKDGSKTRATRTAGFNSGVGCLAGLHNDDRKLRLHAQLGNLWRCRFVLSPSNTGPTAPGPLHKIPDLNLGTTAASPNASLLALSHATEYSTFASKSAVPCGRQRAQSCPGRILLRARPCDGPGFVPGNRGRPSARSAELQAIHRRPLHPWSPLHKAPPNPTCSRWCVAQSLPLSCSYESPYCKSDSESRKRTVPDPSLR